MFSTLATIKSILHKWKLREPESLEHLDDLLNIDDDEKQPPSHEALKQKWKEHLRHGSHQYNCRRCRNDGSDENKKYRHFVPSKKGPKPYLTNFNKKSKLKLRVLAETKKAKCLICGLSNVPLAEHIC